MTSTATVKSSFFIAFTMGWLISAACPTLQTRDLRRTFRLALFLSNH
jgi:hypothetical protein